MRTVFLLLLLLLAVDLCRPTQVLAAPVKYAQEKANRAASAAEAADIARQRYGGEVLKVQTLGEGKSRKYKVRLLTDDGRVREVMIKGQ